MMCGVEGCERPRRSAKAELCNTHYFRVRRTGSTGGAEIWDRKPKPCEVEGCQRRAKRRGMCETHRRRVEKYGDPLATGQPLAGEANPAWRGSDVGYAAAHDRVRRARGRAAEHRCVCGDQARHWAYDHADPDEIHRPDGIAYSGKPEHYVPLCVPCHKRADLGRTDSHWAAA